MVESGRHGLSLGESMIRPLILGWRYVADRLCFRPLRVVLALLFQHHPHRPLPCPDENFACLPIAPPSQEMEPQGNLRRFDEDTPATPRRAFSWAGECPEVGRLSPFAGRSTDFAPEEASRVRLERRAADDPGLNRRGFRAWRYARS